MSTLSEEQVERTIAFHGHSCPGLAIGMRAGEWCLNELGRPEDEEIIAIVETDMCGVDAIQFLCSCTFGKGNLFFLDYGKTAFGFHRRSDGKSARLLLDRSIMSDMYEKQNRLDPADLESRNLIRSEIIERIMTAPLEKVFRILPLPHDIPEKARILESVQCDNCGEHVMATRVREKNGKRLCIPCDKQQ